MATTVYDVLEIRLQNGEEVTIRPVDIKRLRKVMAVIEDMNKAARDSVAAQAAAEEKGEEYTDDFDNLEFLLRACRVCLEKQAPDLVKDEDAFEEALDLPTITKILEVGAGITIGGSNFPMGAAQPGLI